MFLAVNLEKHSVLPGHPHPLMWYVAKHAGRRLQHARGVGRLVFGKDDAVGGPPLPKLAREFREAMGLRYVEDRVRTEAVTITAADHRETKAFGQGQHTPVLRPRTVPIELERMDALAVEPEKGEERGIVSPSSHVVKIP